VKAAFHLTTAALVLATACAGVGQKPGGGGGGAGGSGAIDAHPDTAPPMDASPMEAIALITSSSTAAASR
jgi:hypothetical protein